MTDSELYDFAVRYDVSGTSRTLLAWGEATDELPRAERPKIREALRRRLFPIGKNSYAD